MDNFFELNPLSQISIWVLIKEHAQPLTNFKDRPKLHRTALELLAKSNFSSTSSFFDGIHSVNEAISKKLQPAGTISLQNGFKVASELLSDAPLYYIKEVLVILGSSNTKDPGDIFEIVKKMKDTYTVCNFVSLSSRLHVATTIAKETSGAFHLVRNTKNFEEIMTVKNYFFNFLEILAS